MTTYQVQVKFRNPNGPTKGAWVAVARAARQEDAQELAGMWQRSADKAKNIVGVRVMSEGKEVKL